MIAEQAAFNYGLLSTDAAVYPRGALRHWFSLTDLNYRPESSDRLADTVDQLRRQAQDERGERRALRELIADDGARALTFLAQSDIDEYDVSGEIEEYFDVAEEYLKHRLALDWQRPDWILTRQFTPPFAERDWFAFAQTVNPSVPGIEFLSRHMMPGVAALATLHENVHHAAQGPGGYLRYFDEGIANLLAYVIYYKHTNDLAPVRLFHAFLDEINVLYAYPPMVRIMASLIQQAGMAGLYELIHQRVTAPDSLDWAKVLNDVRMGQLDVAQHLGDDNTGPVPQFVAELEQPATKILGIILFPERVLVSPIAYQIFTALCDEGDLALSEIRRRWDLTPGELTEILAQLQDPHAVWSVQSERLALFGHSEIIRPSNIIRAHLPA